MSFFPYTSDDKDEYAASARLERNLSAASIRVSDRLGITEELKAMGTLMSDQMAQSYLWWAPVIEKLLDRIEALEAKR